MSVGLLVFYIVALIGASDACARLFRQPPPVGFALLPVVISYMGFLHLWRLPYLSTILAGLAAIYGMRTVSRLRWDVRWIFPAAVLLILLLTKWGYLHGGLSDGDEVRSILLTSSFANNALKPAYPFDFSMPLAYPYYLFETSAFLYHAAAGFLLPSIAVLATTLVTVALFYQVLALICDDVFDGRHFIPVSAVLTVSGVFGLNRLDEMLSFVNYQIQPFSSYLHSGYHYLFGTALAVWGLAQLGRYFRDETGSVPQAVLLLCLSFGFSGIPAVWAGAAAIVVVLHYLCRNGGWIRLAQLAPKVFVVAIMILLPQVFSFLPRFDPSFTFSLPHAWLLRDAQLVMLQSGGFSLWRLLVVGPAIMVTNIGPLLFAGFVAAIYGCTRKSLRWEQQRPFTIGIVVSMLLLTFTDATKSDWFSRGFLFPTILSAFVAAMFLENKSWRAIAMTLLIPQGISVALEHRSHVAPPAMHEQAAYPLGTVFSVSQYDPQIVHRGRAQIVRPPDAYTSYILHPDVLEKLGITRAFGPCLLSVFGSNVPSGEYIARENGMWVKRTCSQTLQRGLEVRSRSLDHPL